MRLYQYISVTLACALAIASARAEPPDAAGAAEAMAPWSKPAAAAAEAAAAKEAAKAAAEARAAATEAKARATAATQEAKAAEAAAAGKKSPPAPVKAGVVAPAPAAPVAARVEPVAAPDAPAKDAGDDPAEPAAAAGGKGKPAGKPAKVLFGGAKSPAALPARAIGGYAKGCLAGGQALSIDGPAWQAMRLSRNRNWGHPKLIALLERFAGEMQKEEKWPGLLIGDLAQPRGGPMLTGHKSHQLGIDADIWFKPMPTVRLAPAERESFEPLLLAKDNGTEVIAENWNEGFVRLVRRVAKYPQVERIFVHPAIKKAFCAAAGTDREWLKKVRPMWLHNYHFHVRMKCPEDSPTCVPQKPVAPEDGCGKEVEDWIKLVSAPPRPPAPKPVVPVKPAKPRPPLMLHDLPLECATVIAAGDPKPVPAKPPVNPPVAASKSKTKSAQQR